jgi:hypothetical protein
VIRVTSPEIPKFRRSAASFDHRVADLPGQQEGVVALEGLLLQLIKLWKR